MDEDIVDYSQKISEKHSIEQDNLTQSAIPMSSGTNNSHVGEFEDILGQMKEKSKEQSDNSFKKKRQTPKNKTSEEKEEENEEEESEEKEIENDNEENEENEEEEEEEEQDIQNKADINLIFTCTKIISTYWKNDKHPFISILKSTYAKALFKNSRNRKEEIKIESNLNDSVKIARDSMGELNLFYGKLTRDVGMFYEKNFKFKLKTVQSCIEHSHKYGA